MGLGESELVEDSDGGCKGASSLVSCSICFEVVMDVGERSWAKLRCGHRFHLDCIGSAFNAKGSMQCPNCRNIEKGQWLYTNGCRPVPDSSMEDWPHDDDLYDFNYTEMSFGVHWCPFSGLTSLPSSLGETEFSSNASHPCPYIAYFGPMHLPSPSSGSVSDGFSFNNHWSGPSVPSEAPTSYAFHSMDAQYCPWDQSSPFPTTARVGGADQASLPSVTQSTSRNNTDISRPGVHPFVMGHSSGIRAPSPVPSPVVPHFSRWPRERVPVQQHFQHSRSTNPAARPRVGLAQVAPLAAPASSSDQPDSGFYSRFHAWGREYHHLFPLNLIDGDSIWAPFQPAVSGATTSTTGRPRHGLERMPMSSQYYHHHHHHPQHQ